MPRRTLLSRSLRDLAAAQAGALGRQQLLAQGIHRRVLARMITDGILTPVRPGIYTFGRSEDWLARAWAGVLLGGRGATLGLDSAAFLLGLQMVAPQVITVFAAQPHADRTGWRFIRSARQSTGEPPRTKLEATVLDLCAGADADRMAALVADAISGRRTTAKGLLAELGDRKVQRNRGLLREILGDVELGAHSALERRYLVEVERAHGLPGATRQHRLHKAHRSDAWYPQYRLIIELDSTIHHNGGAAFHDMTRDNDHALLGVTTLRLGWTHVTGSGACLTAQEVGEALMHRGWEGPIRRCPRCRLVPEGQSNTIGHR